MSTIRTTLRSLWLKTGVATSLGLMSASNALAQATPYFGLDKLQPIGLSANDPRVIASNIIKVFLGFLGLIAVSIVLVGGFQWMTALGDEEKVKKAKKLIGSGVVGLIIILAAFAIVNFVLDQIVIAVRTTG